MDKIILRGIKLFGYHGCLDFEKIDGQYFYIDVELFYDTKIPAENDELNHAVDYSKVYEDIKEEFTLKSYNLIETVANKICDRILLGYKLIEKIHLSVRKPNAPIKGEFEDVGVVIERVRLS